MSVRLCLTLLLALAAAVPRFGFATSAENGMFTSATRALRTQLYEQAERDFAQFIQQFPESPRLPEAILAMAEARFKQGNYTGALDLLTTRQNQAGKWADELLFWIGECYVQKNDLTKAAQTFAQLAKEYPYSARLLEAVVKEAAAQSKLNPPNWIRVTELLQASNGVFQAAAQTNAASDWVARGNLLLGEAYLAQTNYHAAEALLTPMANRLMNPALAWERQYLICRAQLADGRAEAALLGTSNLLIMARSSEQSSLVAQSTAFKARVLEMQGRSDLAIEAYNEILVTNSPGQYQQQALLKISKLSVAQNKIPDAVQTLEKFVATYPKAAAADIAWLTLGELRLRLFASPPTNAASTNAPLVSATNMPPSTNYLDQARLAFETLTTEFPKSPQLGLGFVDLGWCLFLLDKVPESQRAFQSGIAHLPLSPEMARAWFKLGDAQFRQTNFAGAAASYNAVVEKFSAFPEVQINLFEPALYQTVHAALAAGDLTSATNAVQKILQWYPNGFHTDRAILLTGQEMSTNASPERARAFFSDFLSKATNSTLLPEVKLAIARTYEQENAWTNAIQEYDLWLTTFTNHPARPRAEFCRALDYWRAGSETNALSSFTNFVALYPTNELAPQAQWWIADFNYRVGDFTGAEHDFQILFRKWPASDLACEARMMAGNAAIARQRWEDAKDYFLKLREETNCPGDLKLKALFAYGDYWFACESTNKTADYLHAADIFSKIAQENPTNEIGLAALGRKGDAFLQAGQFDEAAKAYQQLTNAAAGDFTLRAQALVGLALTLEKQAEKKNGPDQMTLLKQALAYCLDVIFPEKSLKDGAKADPDWTKRAGYQALHLAEAMKDWNVVISISKELTDSMPVLRLDLEKKIAKAKENLRAGN